MKLEIKKRTANKKSEANKLRREGFIHAVIYAKGKEGEPIAVSKSAYQALARTIKPGHLPTTIFSLTSDSGKARRVIIKEIQYHVTTYDVLHLDFEELFDDSKIDIKVPIECTGVADCIGVKLGGVLRYVIRHVKVRCLPKDIPSQFLLDVKELGQRQSRRLRDIAIPDGVRALADLNEVAVAIVKR